MTGSAANPLDPVIFSISDQRRELERRWQAYHEDHRMVPGMDAVEKPGLGQMNAETRLAGMHARVFRIWRMLDLADPIDQALCEDWIDRHAINKLDCVIGYLSDDGVGMIFEPHELLQLMPVPEESDASNNC